jgi:hypothetical protein
MGDVDLAVIPIEQDTDDGRTHALDRAVANRSVEDSLIRELHRRNEAALVRGQTRVVLTRPLHSRAVGIGRIEVGSHFGGRHAACDVTCPVAAHPIGDHEQPVL